jgi:polysaccharide export outer membrane protein
MLLGVAIAAAGCTQPAAYMAYPSAAMPGIDNVVYGAAAPYARGYAGVPGYGAAPGYAAAPAPSYVAAPGYAAPYVPPAAPAPYGGLYGYAGFRAPSIQSGYTLDAGDRLRVVVFGQDGLTNSYAVDAGGYIDMPLIGAVLARGATTDQLAARIGDKLRDGFIREPHVAVEVEAYRPFFILGEVTQPGQYPYVANMTAETAVAIAGGFSARAFRKTVTLNRNYYGHPMRISVPLTFPLRPGDTINVQERWF